MKENIFRIAKHSNVVAVAYLQYCKISDDWFTVIEFESDVIAAAIYDALRDSQYDVTGISLSGNTFTTESSLVRFEKYNHSYVKVIWYEESFSHIQVTEGAPRHRKFNLIKK